MITKGRLQGLYVFLLFPLGLAAAILALLLYQWGELAASGLCGVFTLVCCVLIIRNHFAFVGDIRREAATAETAERFRAEQAETYVEELRHYVEELERSTR